MLDKRQRVTGLAALSLTAVGAVAGLEGTAYPTSKEPRPAVTGGGWLTDPVQRVHFALSAHQDETGDFGHLNIKLEGNLGAFWADITSVQVFANSAQIEGVVRKADGVYAGCTGEPFDASAHDGEASQEGDEGDFLQGGCASGPRFGGEVENGNLQVKGSQDSPR